MKKSDFLSFGAAPKSRPPRPAVVHRPYPASGADGVEVRGELLRDAATELPALAGFSSVLQPRRPTVPQGALDEAALARGVQAARSARAAPEDVDWRL